MLQMKIPPSAAFGMTGVGKKKPARVSLVFFVRLAALFIIILTVNGKPPPAKGRRLYIRTILGRIVVTVQPRTMMLFPTLVLFEELASLLLLRFDLQQPNHQHPLLAC